MRVLVVGSGGREHALCRAIAGSARLGALYCAPGNAGIARQAACIDIASDDLDALVAFATAERIDLVVVGPEAPLVAGLVDRLEAVGIKAFGPRAAAAMLEGSKAFAKDFCIRHGIPTADYRRFSDPAAAKAHIRARGAPIVVKADGLAAGKGVVVAETVAEAEAAVEAMMTERAFGDSGAQIVVEEFLQGEEASFFALSDGGAILPLAGVQDHKRVGDGDVGPNTGGMGACSPAPAIDPAMADRIVDEIVRPTIRAMAQEGRAYRGVLYAGLMITDRGPKLIEYNVRFGDPECQALMLRIKGDVLSALLATVDGQLAHFELRWRDETALCVVMAARGYPGAYENNTVISGVDAAESDDVLVFHAATARGAAGELLATGGRVLGVTALGADPAQARARAYAAVDAIDWPQGFCRRDIGRRALPARQRPCYNAADKTLSDKRNPPRKST